MKLIVLTMLLMVYSNHLSAEQCIANVKPKQTIITGSFLSDKLSINVKVIDLSEFRIFTEDSKTYYKIDSSIKVNNGKLVFEMQINHPVFVRIGGALAFNAIGMAHSTHGFLIEPGDSLNVDLNIQNINHYSSLTISGRGSEKHLCIQKIISNLKTYRHLKELKDLSQKLARADSITATITKTISEFKVSSVARSIINATYIPMLAGNLVDHILESNVDIHDPRIKKTFNECIKTANKIIDPLDSNLKYTSGFEQVLIKRGLMHYAMIKGVDYPHSEYSHEFYANRKRIFNKDYYDALVNYISNSPIKEKILSGFIIGAIKAFGFNPEIEASVKAFLKQTNASSSFNKGIKILSDKYMKRLAKGAEAFVFALPDTSGKIVKISDFKGKVIVLDFMFTGCGGCALMVPYLSKVEHKFKDNPNVIFIAISVTKDLKEVKKAYGIFCTKGSILLYTEGRGYDHPIHWFYNPQYPTLVVIDPEGKIVSPAAPDPRRDDGKALTDLIEQTIINN